jgi:hypothetical protein
VSQGSFPSNQTDLGLITSKMSAMVDLRQVKTSFQESVLKNFIMANCQGKMILRHLIKSQPVKCLGLRYIAPIPSPNLAHIPQIDVSY